VLLEVVLFGLCYVKFAPSLVWPVRWLGAPFDFFSDDLCIGLKNKCATESVGIRGTKLTSTVTLFIEVVLRLQLCQ